MRFIAIHVLAMAVAACANNDTAWSRLDAERHACQARIMASPEFRALQYRFQSTNGNKATPAEAAQMVTFHQDYLRPCQEVELEIAGRTHPSLPPLYNAAAAKADASIAMLVTYQISWGEYVRAYRPKKPTTTAIPRRTQNSTHRHTHQFMTNERALSRLRISV
jgi:hypothetical protein